MQKIHEEVKKFLESKVLVKPLYVVGVLLVIMIIFSAGVVVGFHKASFGRDWGEHYSRNFGMTPMRHGFLGKDGDYFPSAHGATGKIIKVENQSIIVQDKDNTEKIILIKDDTKIQKVREEIVKTDLKLDDFVVVIGTPNAQGQIEAKLIRVIPAPEFLTPIKP